MKATGSPRAGAGLDWFDTMKSKYRWPSYGMCTMCPDKLPHRACGLSSTYLYYFLSILSFSFVGVLFSWLVFSPYKSLSGAVIAGCQPDNEGSWSIGLYRGSSPFSLQPLEAVSTFFNPSLLRFNFLFLILFLKCSRFPVQVNLSELLPNEPSISGDWVLPAISTLCHLFSVGDDLTCCCSGYFPVMQSRDWEVWKLKATLIRNVVLWYQSAWCICRQTNGSTKHRHGLLPTQYSHARQWRAWRVPVILLQIHLCSLRWPPFTFSDCSNLGRVGSS